MKKIINLLLIITLLATTNIASAQNPVRVPSVSKKETPKPSQTKKKTTPKAKKETPNYNGHEYVDLGLPSHLKWATKNIGAYTPYEKGSYFAWGEITPKTTYTKENSKTNGKKLGDISGNPTYDAARANWGGSWRMPTAKEFEELINNCRQEKIHTNGINIIKLIGPNGNYILFPCAGFSAKPGFGDYGGFFTSTPDEKDANKTHGAGYYFDGGMHGVYSGWDRWDGRTIRAVSI